MSRKNDENDQLLSYLEDKENLTFSSDEEDAISITNLIRYIDTHAY